MGVKEPSFGTRLTGIGSTIMTGVALFVLGIIGIVVGDGPGNTPSYHPGGMILFAILFVALYLFIELLVVPPNILKAPRVQLAFLGWMGIGAVIVGTIEHFNPGECCSDPAVSGLISRITLWWPTTFTVALLVGLIVLAIKSKVRPAIVENDNSNYPRD